MPNGTEDMGHAMETSHIKERLSVLEARADTVVVYAARMEDRFRAIEDCLKAIGSVIANFDARS